MYIQLAYNRPLPVHGYGGTERVVWALAQELHRRGCRVHLLAPRGSSWPHGPLTHLDPQRPLAAQLDPEADLLHTFFPFPPEQEPQHPYVLSIGGNAQPGETYPRNTTFRTANHAHRHGASAYVYNGLDPADYGPPDWSQRRSHLVFLAKASWRVKNLAGARRIARKAAQPLAVLGGRGWEPTGRIRYYGMQGGSGKRELLNRGRALLFPVRWPEPFGLAVIEALYFGLPVFATPFGSLPELVPPDCGVLSDSLDDLAVAARYWADYSPRRLHDWVRSRFSVEQMAEGYLAAYQQVLRGEALNPRASQSPLLARFRRYPLRP